MELAMPPAEGFEQMPMHVPIGGLGQQVPMQPLSQQQQQLLQQHLLNQKNQQHLQTLLLQQALGQSQQAQPQQAQLPNLLTGRIDPAALPLKTSPATMPGVTTVPFYPWIYPLDQCMVGSGVMPGAWGVVGVPGAGSSLQAVQAPEMGTKPETPEVAQAKKRSGRGKGKKDFEAASSTPLAVGELLGNTAVLDALAEVRRDGAKSQVLLRDVLTHVAELAQDSEGSRFLQAKLETANTAERREVFEALLPKMEMLAGDSSGSAVVQKLLDICTPDQRRAIVERFRQSVVKLSLKMHGCRVIQKAFQVCPPELQSMLAGELKNGVIDCIKSMHGNHVVQKCIEQMPPESVSFVVEAVEDKAEAMAAHIYGCRIIQRLLEHCTPKRLERMLQQILRSIRKLSTDPYGNYVIRHILEHGNPEHKKCIVSEVCNHVLELGKDKHASNVVEKCFEASTTGEHAAFLKDERQRLIRAVLGPVPKDPTDRSSPLVQLMDDRFGKYVANSLVEYSRGPEEMKVLYSRIASAPGKKASITSLLEMLERQLQQAQYQQMTVMQFQPMRKGK
eukprot:CAMPEP_0181435362 /NCGR_PEP_ID=MMETSP1110-20121109/20292_1 /TAXON_ID=174948 /ORGANISM="Symbiodinium sp., Strain CCMP421" /LENGTH=560 /DNA_ID=CAMNT_0023558891 /DNA_START=53 /DNA_END=1735 /DNA_ORIENTATION=-